MAIFFALEDGGERQVTWTEIDEGATRLAHAMKDRGVTQGDWIAIALKNSPEHLMSCFAGWKLGAVVVPMRWDLPEWERDRVLDAVTCAPQRDLARRIGAIRSRRS